MRKAFVAIVAVAMLGAVYVIDGCAQKATNSQEAIQHAQTLKTPQEQADYLVGQANAFLASKQYNDAVASAQQVLSKIDPQSKAAKDVLDKAKNQLAAAAKQATGNVQKAAGNMKKSLGF